MRYLIRTLQILIGWPFLVVITLGTIPLELIFFVPYYIITGKDYLDEFNPLPYAIMSYIGGDGFAWKKIKIDED